MDACAMPVRFVVLIVLLPLCLVLSIPAADCSAECSHYGGLWSHEPYFDGSVLAAWSRTWHAPTPWSTPLPPYYVPRTAPSGYGGEFAGCANHCGTGAGFRRSGPYEGLVREDAGDCGVEGGFERIGHIPNELNFAGPLPPGAPPVPPQR
jgi:hypothetical protein